MHGSGIDERARLYPPASPALGLEWLRLAKLRAHCDELAGAVDAFELRVRKKYSASGDVILKNNDGARAACVK